MKRFELISNKIILNFFACESVVYKRLSGDLMSTFNEIINVPLSIIKAIESKEENKLASVPNP